MYNSYKTYYVTGQFCGVLLYVFCETHYESRIGRSATIPEAIQAANDHSWSISFVISLLLQSTAHAAAATSLPSSSASASRTAAGASVFFLGGCSSSSASSSSPALRLPSATGSPFLPSPASSSASSSSSSVATSSPCVCQYSRSVHWVPAHRLRIPECATFPAKNAPGQAQRAWRGQRHWDRRRRHPRRPRRRRRLRTRAHRLRLQGRTRRRPRTVALAGSTMGEVRTSGPSSSSKSSSSSSSALRAVVSVQPITARCAVVWCRRMYMKALWLHVRPSTGQARV